MHALLVFYHPHQKQKSDPKSLQGHGLQRHFRYSPLFQKRACTSKYVAYKNPIMLLLVNQ
jgi:hypothetical protein